MVADGLLHGALECLVGGADGQQEVLGVEFPLRKEAFIQRIHLLLLC